MRLVLVHDLVHPVLHRLDQPCHCFFGDFFRALDHQLVVDRQDQASPRAFVPAVPQEGHCELQAVRSGALYGAVEAFGIAGDAQAATADEGAGLGVAVPSLPVVPSFEPSVGLKKAGTILTGFRVRKLDAVGGRGIGPKSRGAHAIE